MTIQAQVVFGGRVGDCRCRKHSRVKQLAIVGSCIAITAGSLAHARTGQHPFTVRDSIELTTFNEPSELQRNAKPTASPDGKHVLVVTTSGQVSRDQVRSTLWIYDMASIRSFVTKDVARQLKPRRLLSVVGVPRAFALDAYDALIRDLRWSEDSSQVYFLRQMPSGDQQLCRVNAHTSAFEAMTPPGYDVQRFAVADGTIVATLSRSLGQQETDTLLAGPASNRAERVVTGLPLVKILFPRGTDRWQDLSEVKLWKTTAGKPGRFLTGKDNAQIDTDVIDLLSVSPHAHFVVRLLPVQSLSKSWRGYEASPVLPRLRIDPENLESVSPRNIMRLKSYALLDLRSGREVFRIQAPTSKPLGLGSLDKAVWSNDEKRLLLTNSFLPLDGVDGAERQLRSRPCLVVDVELPSTEARCLSFGPSGMSPAQAAARSDSLRDVKFGDTPDEVILDYGGAPEQVERYRMRGGTWDMDTPPPGPESKGLGRPHIPVNAIQGLDVTIRQSLNASPSLWATDRVTGRTKQLWNPNPQLSHVKLGDATTYRWQGDDGVEWTGGLIKPIDYIPGRRYPLVIQTHGFSDAIFKEATDGAFPTGMAARPLASEGMMVLQVPDNPGDFIGSRQEASRHVEGFRSAIAQLSREGLIDPKRVGVVGFSRTCWYVESALIQYPSMFAAAAIADGVDESYMQYLLFAQEDETWGEEFEQVNEAKPIGEGLQKWIAHAPGFQLSRVRTPLRIEAIGPRSVLLEWEIYSSLEQQHKPVELTYVPKGQHILQRPLDRLASQQGTVDWFRFWLEGSEDPNPSGRVRLRRWEAMRSLAEAGSQGRVALPRPD
jgi:hypothetical protein